MEHPARLAHCQRVLAVPFKRTGSRPVEYLEHEEIEAILGAVDRGTADGRRDYALLATMFNTAVHLLRAGVDIVTISQWLGHASVTTTHRYATVDLDMKRQALAKARPTTRATAGPALWRTDSSVLEWLEAL